MALKAIHASGVHAPNLDHIPIPDNPAFLLPPHLSSERGEGYKWGKFIVAGHRGSGMNILQSSDPRMKRWRENSIKSFNNAAKFNLDFVEFDVQVTKDGCPVIFHDIHILTQNEGTIIERRVTEITLAEFLSYGPQREPGKVGKPLFRKTKDGSVFEWKVENDDPLCTLEEVFENVDESLGFNIELKFDDNKKYEEAELRRIHQAVLKIVNEHDKGRLIIFSSFQPDAAQLMKKLQDTFPVFFLTNGGCEIYTDPRRNSLEEAINLCLEAGLDGIVSQAKAIFRHPSMVGRIKDSRLSLLTYGQLNNLPEAVYIQHLMGVDGVIVDFVQEIKEAVSDFTEPLNEKEEKREENSSFDMEEKRESFSVHFSDRELSFLLKLIPGLLQN
uniref:glycerophosphodiester phosphodiesterase n=1 Tax=Opuntia streptacantha TaxID=393608 RepID=A0A7C9A157_OPUST